MKCKFCGSEVPEGEIRCGICGFTHVNFTDGDNSAALEKMVAKYRESKFKGITINLISHKYTIENGEFKDYTTESIKIADAAELESEKPVWLKKNFLGSETDKTIVVEICVGGKEKTYYNFSFDIKKTDSLSVGVIRSTGLMAKICIGTPEHYILSEEFSLVNNE